MLTISEYPYGEFDCTPYVDGARTDPLLLQLYPLLPLTTDGAGL
jgi:hypothetical protein